MYSLPGFCVVVYICYREDMDLTGKHIVITGGQRVGQYVAKELQAVGANLSMSYQHNPDEVASGAQGFQLNVLSEKSIRTGLSEVQKRQPIDGLVNMVSVFQPDSKRVTLDEMIKTFTINAAGNMLISRLFAEHIQERGLKNAPIISFIDWAVDHPYANYDIYIAAKAALRHYLMALQTTFSGVVRVVNIHPGMILEPRDLAAEEKEKIVHNTPVKAIGSPEQAAHLVRLALELDYLATNVFLDGGQNWRHRL